MPLLYDIGTALYHAGIRAAAPFKPKARQWVDGRKGLWERLEARRDALHGCLWMHCASVGEFEQGLPVLEAIKREHPDLPVLLTFYSPSGYEARKGLGSDRAGSLVTHVEYLPPDGVANAQRLLAMVRPKAALWVKYEFWYHHLAALMKARVPTFLVSAIFREEQPFFRWYGGTHRRMLRCFTQVFVQDEASFQMLGRIGITNATMSGDTRFDRVAAIAATSSALPLAQAFRGNGPVLVCGSTWPADEALLSEAFSRMEQAPKCLVAPHELEATGLLATEQHFPKPLARWSELEAIDTGNVAAVLGAERSSTLLVDRMGLLARLYQHGDVAYVGGGFGDGIHSLLEPAAWGLPVIFGPRHGKFAEARGLIAHGGGFEVRDAGQLHDILGKLLGDPAFRAQASQRARAYVQERTGASAKVLQAVEPVL